MEGGGASGAVRPVIYCVIPCDLAAKLHEPLRKHFRADARVEVVVEQRLEDRRVQTERRTRVTAPVTDRRRIRNLSGRRVGERRETVVPVDAPELPRRLQRYALQLLFVERLAMADVAAEDLDTGRLVTRFQAGDPEVFALIYMRYFDRLYNYMRLVMRDGQEAEDATQHVFMKVLEALPRYERRSQPFRAWLFTIARNYATSQLRKKPELPLEPEQLERHTARSGRSEADLRALEWISDPELLLFIERLPLVQRQVLVLRYMLDLSHAEVATALDRTPEAVRALQHRALRLLEERLTAVGRAPRGLRAPQMRRWPRRAPVLRARRWSLVR